MLHIWIRKQRDGSGLSQQEVADKLGKTQTYISRVESGQIRITVQLLQQLSVAIGFDLSAAVKLPTNKAA